VSADHRKPVVAFVLLALTAATLVGVQRADARGDRLVAALIGAGVQAHGMLPPSRESAVAAIRAAELVKALNTPPGRGDTALLTVPALLPLGAAATAALETDAPLAAEDAVTAHPVPGTAAPDTVRRDDKAAHRAARKAAHAQRSAKRLEQRSDRKRERAAMKAARAADRAAWRASRDSRRGHRVASGDSRGR
jgi:hypothetical protein